LRQSKILISVRFLDVGHYCDEPFLEACLNNCVLILNPNKIRGTYQLGSICRSLQRNYFGFSRQASDKNNL